MDQPIEESSGSDNDGLRANGAAIAQLYSCRSLALRSKPLQMILACRFFCACDSRLGAQVGLATNPVFLRVSVCPWRIFCIFHDQLGHLSLLDEKIRLAF